MKPGPGPILEFNGENGSLLEQELRRDFGPATPKEFLKFLRPSELRDYQPPEGLVLVGDNHVTRGSAFVIGGAPGVGKSRTAVALAVAGATGADWFGKPIQAQFRTMIIQTENGRYRLKQEFTELDCETLDKFVRITPPPPYGLCFNRPEFRDQLSAEIAEFDPGLIILDPWNAAARDDRARDYLETYDAIRSVIPAGESSPAIGIIAHTRKPQQGERASGRALLNLLAGSYVLGSLPRCVFILQSASDDVAETRVVCTCCKNNDGELGPRSAWERRNGLFVSVENFDWQGFDNPEPGSDSGISTRQMQILFESGPLKRKQAVERLIEITGRKKSQCYDALKLDGRFSKHLVNADGELSWVE
jgi:hypothetical protein